MPSPTFQARTEYRNPKQDFSMVGSEGVRSPGNIPRTYGGATGVVNGRVMSVNGTPDKPMNSMYSHPDRYEFGAIDQNPKKKELPPMLGRPLAFSWAGRTAHPDLTPTTIKLDKYAQPIYLETGIGALRYDNEGTGFAINQTYKDDGAAHPLRAAAQRIAPKLPSERRLPPLLHALAFVGDCRPVQRAP